RMRALLAAGGEEDDLAGMSAVGWFRPAAQRELFLNQADIAVCDRYFDAPWQITALLQTSGGLVRVGIFFREDDGFLRNDQSYREFTLQPEWTPPLLPLIPEVPRLAPPAVVTPMVTPVVAPMVATPSRDAAPRTRVLVRKRRKRKPERLWMVPVFCLIVALAVASAGVWLLRPPPASTGLRMEMAQKGVVIHWNPYSPAIAQASEASLILEDDNERIEVPVLRARDPFFAYQPVGHRLSVRLRTVWGLSRRKQEETLLHIVHPSIGQPSSALVEVRKAKEEAQRELEDARALVDGRTAELNELRERAETVQRKRSVFVEDKRQTEANRQRAMIAAARAAAYQSVNRPEPAREIPEGPTVPFATKATAQPEFGLPTMPPPPVKEEPILAAALQGTPVKDVAKRAAALAPITTPPAQAVARSGTVIWNGNLAPGKTLTIENGKPSTGFLSAGIPFGVPMRISAAPAQLSGGGLKIYTDNPKHPGLQRPSPPSPSNAWNRTEYVYDVKAAHALRLVGSPSPPGWERIVMQTSARTISAIVVEWQVTTP
ncbi:MAG: hypothetical protein HYZ37_05330, partial [Candidatus Solibacter usitatus]|nr:hypothetical protein [Candidatus Solibacter usitatus]